MMKLYAMTIMAWRQVDTEWTIYLTHGVVLATSDDDAEQRSMPAALRAFPEVEGFANHRIVVAELPSPLIVEGYQVDWSVTTL